MTDCTLFAADALDRRPFQALTEARILRPGEDAPLAELPVEESFEFVVVNVCSAGGIFNRPDGDESGAAP